VQNQICARFDLPRQEYESRVHRFNPVQYDPEQWGLPGKECGMECICFPTRHHDGFCMWDAKETDEFSYGVRSNSAIVTKKNGKSCHRFPGGLISSAVVMENDPGMPKSARLLNTGEALSPASRKLPEFFRDETGQAGTFLHIPGIPVDKLENEPIVLEIEW